MTLLDEYQALPGEPARVPVDATPEGLYARIRMMQGQRIRRDAIVRLLCRALRETLNDMSEPTFSDPRISYIEVQVTPSQLAEARALLTAVERDFQEGA